MKKKLLEINVDECGKYSFNTDYEDFELANLLDVIEETEFEKKLYPLVEGLVLEIFKKENMALGQVIRFLTIANICADGQPYEHIEQLWSTMMNGFLPKYEKKYSKMKASYGFLTKVCEPVRWVNPQFADLFGIKKS